MEASDRQAAVVVEKATEKPSARRQMRELLPILLTV
jgi:hypothetical protein